MKTIILHVHPDAGQESRLQTALALARATGGHVVCLQNMPIRQFVSVDLAGGAYVMPEVLEAVREEEAAVRAAMESRLAQENISWDWRTVDGEAVDALEQAARLADIIVVSLASTTLPAEQKPADIAGPLAMHAACAVLGVPVGVPLLSPASTAMVAWDGSAQAARAVRLALPLLRLASNVHVVTVAQEEEDDIPDLEIVTYLSRHAVAAELRSWSAKGRSVEETLCDAASELGANCLVMGAYGHSRLRELVFGGVTKFILKQAPLPIMLAH